MAYDTGEAHTPTIRGKRGPPPGTRFGGRQKGTLNKATVARQAAEAYASEAIEALRSVCVDSSADRTARIQAACKLLDLLPSQKERTSPMNYAPSQRKRDHRGGKRPGSGRKKGTLNKATVARQAAQFYTAEAIEALRSVCADSAADKMARVLAAYRLLALLPSHLLQTKGVLPEQCSHQHLADAIIELDADWVVLSACNTAAGEKGNAEPLSGLARAFFYANARALLVSHWAVNSNAAVKLTTQTFAELRTNPSIGRAEALRRSMVALITRGAAYDAHPALWGPFALVGEGGSSHLAPQAITSPTPLVPPSKGTARQKPKTGKQQNDWKSTIWKDSRP
jgi:hypothetical protein